MSQNVSSEGGNTKSPSRSRSWCYTWNNYREAEYSAMVVYLTQQKAKYICGKEIGENGTPHIQGWCEFPNQKRFDTLKLAFPKVHWEKAKGGKEANYKYCSKEGNFHTNIKMKEPIKIISKLKPWQKEIEELIKSDPDDRTIHWYWDREGGKGKTALVKYLLVTYDYVTYSCASKSADILSIADEDKSVYLLNFARVQENFCPYTAMEQLKDGLISDSKLKKKSNNIVMNSPHVICFANWPPDMTKLSSDRWCVMEINERGFAKKHKGFDSSDDESDY